MYKHIKEIVSYRDMIASLVRRDLRGRYKGSFLGFLWNFINPLCQIIVYIMVFSFVFESNIEKFYLYLIIGMMPWIFFSESLGQGAGCIVYQADMTKKIYFPREVLPLATVTSRFVNMCLTFLVLFGIIIFSGIGFNIQALLFLPVVMIIEYIMTLGFTLLLSAITVYFRDIEHITNVILMAWVWLTPIMYDIQMAKDWMKVIVKYNPVTPLIEAYHAILYNRVIPDLSGLRYSILLSIVILVLGEVIFIKLEGGFAEEL